jgi:hypothetical protein
MPIIIYVGHAESDLRSAFRLITEKPLDTGRRIPEITFIPRGEGMSLCEMSSCDFRPLISSPPEST